MTEWERLSCLPCCFTNLLFLLIIIIMIIVLLFFFYFLFHSFFSSPSISSFSFFFPSILLSIFLFIFLFIFFFLSYFSSSFSFFFHHFLITSSIIPFKPHLTMTSIFNNNNNSRPTLPSLAFLLQYWQLSSEEAEKKVEKKSKVVEEVHALLKQSTDGEFLVCVFFITCVLVTCVLVKCVLITCVLVTCVLTACVLVTCVLVTCVLATCILVACDWLIHHLTWCIYRSFLALWGIRCLILIMFSNLIVS